MIPHKWIISAVRDRVQANINLVSDIEYPGMRLDKRALTKWLEVLVLSSSSKRKQRQDKDRRKVQILFRIWCKEDGNIYTHQKIAAQIAQAFDRGLCEPIIDRGTVGSPQIGTLTFFEPTTTNRTPDSESRLRTTTRCLVISLSAIAQEN